MIYNENIISKDYVETELKTYHIPGMGICVSRGSEILLEAGYGYKNLKTRERISEKTQWCIASCSKAFTSTLIAMLVDQGKMDYDTPIREYIPDFAMYDSTASNLCTIRDMLLHRTGLSEHDAVWVDNCSRNDLLNRLRYLKPRAPFRQEMIYNNTIYTIIGAIAERVSGLSWEQMVREWIFEPLGMTQSFPSLKDLQKSKDMATPYWNYDGTVKELKLWDIGPGEPCGGIVTSLEEGIHWVRFNMQKGNWNGKQLVSKKQMEEMHRMQIPTEIWPWEWEHLPSHGAYGLGWFGCQYRGNQMVFHLGEIEGYCTLMAFLPEQDLSFVSFVNLHKPCVLAQFSVLYTILDNLLGLSAMDWNSRFQEKLNDFGEFYQHWNYDLLENYEPVPDTQPAHSLPDYAGDYWNDGYGLYRIVVENRELKTVYRGVKQHMQHFHYETFKVCDIKEDTLLISAPLTFYTDPYTGKVNRLLVDLDPESDSIEFVRKK